mmetsp:Transcript_17608/g.52395  ORF Transcript_17608/g.52395 Transcript_17608/m.52395 type:complete len:138 (+) Transcript_17608:254-667(+)
MDGEDDAASLNFGPEFPVDQVECLSDAEVATILDGIVRQRVGDAQMLRKAHEYTKRSIGARATEDVKAEAVQIRQALTEMSFDEGGALHVFEIASLTNLMARDSEPAEAKALVPSLARFNDESLQTILDAVGAAKQV